MHALRLVSSLAWFWYFRGYLREGRTWIDRAIVYVDRAGRSAVAGKALSAAGVLAFLQSDLEPAKERLERAVELWRELQDPRGIGFALTFLGRVVAQMGGDSGARLAEEGEAIFEQIGEKWGRALSLDFLGEAAREEGDETRATELHDRSMALYREMGHRWGVALELSNFGEVAMRRGDGHTA
jgi:tetratricopeptide (TPR) repeat protein